MMALTIQDGRQLRHPLAIFGLVLVIATLLYSYTGEQRTKAQQSLMSQQNALAQAREQYLASGAERDNIARYLAEYRRLEQRGFIGEERRVDWIDSLRRINQRHKLFAIGYDIGIQQDYKPAILNTGAFKLHRSVMKLSFPMLHEGDLLTLLQSLPMENNTPFMLRDCLVTRRTASSEGNLTPNLDASCEIDWLTITEPVRAMP